MFHVEHLQNAKIFILQNKENYKMFHVEHLQNAKIFIF